MQSQQATIHNNWRQQWAEALDASGKHRIDVLERLECFGPGFSHSGSLRVIGDLGDYAFSNLDQTDVRIKGNVGYAAGQSMRGGQMIVQGDAGAMLGANSAAGTIIVQGNVGDDCGAAIDGMDLVVVGNVANNLGRRMTSGSIIVGGDAGEDVGFGAIGGVLFIRGGIGSLDSSFGEVRMREPDRFRLSLILSKNRISMQPKDFRLYRYRS